MNRYFFHCQIGVEWEGYIITGPVEQGGKGAFVRPPPLQCTVLHHITLIRFANFSAKIIWWQNCFKIIQIWMIWNIQDIWRSGKLKKRQFRNNDTTSKKWVVGSKIWHLRKSVKTKFVGIKRLDWNYFMLFFDISKFLDPVLTFLDVVSLFLNCPLLIMSGVFLNIFFLIITSNLEPWSDSFVTFYDLAL